MYLPKRKHPKNFIKSAIKRPGALTEKAEEAGEGVQEYAQEHKHSSGLTGQESRFDLVLRGLAGKKKKR